MVKLEIDLTDEQMEKVKQLEEKDISVGEAIDMLFEAKEQTLSQADKVNKHISVYDSVKETALDVDNKQKILENDYGEADKTYDVIVQETKANVKWAKEFFKF